MSESEPYRVFVRYPPMRMKDRVEVRPGVWEATFEPAELPENVQIIRSREQRELRIDRNTPETLTVEAQTCILGLDPATVQRCYLIPREGLNLELGATYGLGDETVECVRFLDGEALMKASA